MSQISPLSKDCTQIQVKSSQEIKDYLNMPTHVMRNGKMISIKENNRLIMQGA